jgi:hypothetical protein
MSTALNSLLHPNVQPPRHSDTSGPVGRGVDELQYRIDIRDRILTFRERFEETVVDEAKNRAVFEEAVKDIQIFVGPQRNPETDRKVIEELIASALTIQGPVKPVVVEATEAVPTESPLNEALHVQLEGEKTHAVERFWEHEKVTVTIPHEDIQAIHKVKDNPTVQKMLLDRTIQNILAKYPRAASRQCATEAIIYAIQNSAVPLPPKKQLPHDFDPTDIPAHTD